jgi:hypothetical protein
MRAKFFGWNRRKQKERSVQDAGITPEAVPSEGGEKEIRECHPGQGWVRESP